MMKISRSLYWKLCVTTALILVIITFTPLVTPHDIYEPKLFGLPYTLWVGILITIGLVVLTFVAARIHQPNKEGIKE